MGKLEEIRKKITAAQRLLEDTNKLIDLYLTGKMKVGLGEIDFPLEMKTTLKNRGITNLEEAKTLIDALLQEVTDFS